MEQGDMTVSHILQTLLAKKDFSCEDAGQIMELLLQDDTSEAQIAAILMGFRFKGETLEEITGFAQGVLRHAVPFRSRRRSYLDTAGTGGGPNTFNISTAAALVIAGAGLAVAKHGNTAVTSRCGSADVLRALGANIDITPEVAMRCFRETGFVFLFAPRYHPILARAAKVRRELGVRTFFNLLGPLCCPARAPFQILGVYQESLTDLMARALGNLNVRRAWVFHGVGGLDEISTIGSTRVTELREGQIRTFYITPEELGFRRASLLEIAGGEPQDNAAIIEGILRGDIRTAAREVVVFNAAVGLCVGGKAADIREGTRMARESIDRGAALRTLRRFCEMTQSP